jgi:crotonobetainyl-CoA:carnitine CoA-transferase CaiB-like acyl-CoA transferase
MTEERREGPLAGVKVLELSRLIAGPSCAQILADLGADVVKVERKGGGDELRGSGPGFLKDANGQKTQESSMFLAFNRNKRSIEMDLSDPGDLKTVRRLVAEADVFIENFKVGVLAKFGLDYESLNQLKPDLIYLSVTGFGLDGPYAMRPGTDGVCQAISGFQSLNGEPDGPSQRANVSVIDMFTGLYAAVSVLAALRNKEVLGGGGQHADSALLDSAMYLVGSRALDYRLTGVVPRRSGNVMAHAAPSQVYACSDGEVFVQAAWDDHFARLCAGLGREDLAADPRFTLWNDRVANRVAMNEVLCAEFAKMTVAVAETMLEGADILHAPINSIAQALDNPQVKHRGIAMTAAHTLGVDAPLMASPIRLSKTPVAYVRPPPMLGEHTEEVLREWLGEAAVPRNANNKLKSEPA